MVQKVALLYRVWEFQTELDKTKDILWSSVHTMTIGNNARQLDNHDQ